MFITIGDQIPNTNFILRGYFKSADGKNRYFVQVIGSDNTLVCDGSQLAELLTSPSDTVKQTTIL